VTSGSGGHAFGLWNQVSGWDAIAIGNGVINSIDNTLQLGWNATQAEGTMTFTDAGYVGIGTTAPAYKLQIDNFANGNTQVKIGGNNIWSSGHDNVLYFGDGSFAYVGETYADDALTLYGAGGMRIAPGGNYGSAGQVLTSDGTYAYWSTPSGGGITGSGTTNYIPLWTPNGTTLGNSRFNQIDANSICLSGVNSWQACAISIYPVNTNTKWAIDGSSLYGSTTSGTGWQFATAGGGGIMGILETAGSYKAGLLGLIYTTGNENTAGVVGSNEDQTYFGALSMYKNAQWYAGWFDGEVDITSNASSRNTLNVSGSVASPQAIGKFTNNYTSTSDAYGVYGYSRPQDYWGIGGQFEGGYYGVNGVVYPTGSNFYYGTRGLVSGGSGYNYGLYGYAYGSGTNYGVYGYAGGGTNWAGYFSGNVALTGALQANGSFGTAGQILTSNGTGAAYWATPSGGGTNYWTNSGSYIYPNTPSANTNIQFWPSTNSSYQMYINHGSTDRYGLSVYEGTYTAGSGYGTGSSRACIEAHDWDGSNYEFGIAGYNYNDYERTAGVIGAQYSASYWGALGYYSSSNNTYGGYFTSHTDGTGFMPNSNTIGIGSGSYGGIMGSWSRGEVLGSTSCGELYASYNIGNVYTSGHQAEIVAVNDKKVAAYAMTSTEVNIYKSGKGKLANGNASITFDETFVQMLAQGETPNVTITPIGDCNGIHIVSMDEKGFVVAENKGGTSDVEFTWIAIGKRIDADDAQLPASLSDKNFDANMKAVMFNENNTDNSAKPIWWDGSKIRFDKIPVIKTDKKEEIKN
ncbi:MAG TPA: hypothetical protein PKN48_12470, partial [Bacteroidales bacterium]|nr:hypothetical protein [Bacteroidales bacterium]